jgi:putative ABC transport system permease protein
MSMAWRKVWRDLWSNKLRTFLVVLATTVGIFALGLVFGLSAVMRAEMTESDFRDNFVPFDALARATGNGNHGALMMVTFDERDSAAHGKLIDDLRDAYAARRIEVVYDQSAGEVREQNMASFDVITYLMLAMAILAAIVGSAGLMSTMSINVVERGREIGVMRAIGAASPAVVGIFVVEGVLIGVLSWLFAVPLSFPGARVFSHLVGVTLMELPLDFRY